ncbi:MULTISPECIES: VRR-NUC domain-containing protein [Bacteroides]|jgi:hypothetical protein|uniref:VRR-NUC domain-containing protein n=1 Tax=Bacteroides stercorirosoris TaxID=871324 RepID=A0A1M6FK56_9BACE|nr:VRR-NUC domain-containing protein [Bacteroides stercorirosoris]MBD9092101.1 VRR-NUC domain-containing protein [Bacteroides oleiciplenus]SHI98022.1 VRR-NUC domain-containing protein [Bacteroides stercorirosoris]
MKPQTESQIQKDCVRWFRQVYPAIEPLFFAVPNGGARNAWTAKIMKDEGVRAGVADLLLLLPRSGYAFLCIEMKKPGGMQSESQQVFQRLVERVKGKYVLCHSLEEFVKEIRGYIG